MERTSPHEHVLPCAHAPGIEVDVTLVLRTCIGERSERHVAQRIVVPRCGAEARTGVFLIPGVLPDATPSEVDDGRDLHPLCGTRRA